LKKGEVGVAHYLGRSSKRWGGENPRHSEAEVIRPQQGRVIQGEKKRQFHPKKGSGELERGRPFAWEVDFFSE